MVNGAHGVDTLIVQKPVEVDSKQKPVLAIILHHLEEEFHVSDQHQNQEAVISTLVQVFIFLHFTQ